MEEEGTLPSYSVSVLPKLFRGSMYIAVLYVINNLQRKPISSWVKWEVYTKTPKL